MPTRPLVSALHKLVALPLSLAAPYAAWAAPTHTAIDSASWSVVTTVKNDNAGDVTISKAVVEGIECYRGTATTDQDPAKMLGVVADVEGAKRWSSAGITEAKLLSRSGDQIAYYQYLDVPGWTMAADRFWFLTSTLVQKGDLAELKWSQLPTADGPYAETYNAVKANHPNAVEPTVNVGSWRFQGVTPAVKMTYSVCTLPGGSIPLAIQNAATKRTLPDTLGDVVREARAR